MTSKPTFGSFCNWDVLIRRENQFSTGCLTWAQMSSWLIVPYSTLAVLNCIWWNIILAQEGGRRSLCLNLIAHGRFTFFFQTLKNFYLNYHKNESADPGVFLLLACGTASSTCGQLASYPLSLVRTRLQAQGMEWLNISLNYSRTSQAQFWSRKRPLPVRYHIGVTFCVVAYGEVRMYVSYYNFQLLRGLWLVQFKAVFVGKLFCD